MDFSKLTAYLDSIPELGVPGCDLAVYRDHEMIYRHSAGFRDVEKKEPVRPDDTYCLYSCTKVFTTCAAMQLIEKELLRLDDPVARYLPAYARLTVRNGDALRPAEKPLLIRHLMSMQSGLNYALDTPAIQRVLQETGGQATTRQLVDAKAEDPLEFEPGEDYLYSAAHDVLAAVIEVVSGQQFSAYLKEHIFAPLHLDTVGFSARDIRRQSAQYMYNELKKAFEPIGPDANSYKLGPHYESGGAGLVSDVHDYITFADALACGGKGPDGAHILSPEMIQLWSANQLEPRSRKTFDAWNRRGYSYGLGVRTRVDGTFGGRGAIGEFGWDGAAGAWTMIDPHNRLSAFYAMHVRSYGYSYDVIHPTLRGLIYESLEL
jgi:CubicO group peptidase (beta-lactamase class C family)